MDAARTLSTALVWLVVMVAPGCSLDVDASGAGRACSLGRCSPGYVCNAERRCVAARGPLDAGENAGGAAEAGGAASAVASGAGGAGAAGTTGETESASPTHGADSGGSGGGTPPADAAGPGSGGSGVSTIPVDASTDAPADAGCGSPTEYYRDRDGDGFGRSGERRLFCGSPPAGWSLRDGDCNDAESRAFPGQTAYFGVGYPLGAGESFDYDCSGSEERDPHTGGPAPNCPALALLVCVGSGYARTGRVGSGVDAICGSATMTTCSGLLACTATSSVAAPKGCR